MSSQGSVRNSFFGIQFKKAINTKRLRYNSKNRSCPDMPASCGWNEFNSPNPNGQILEGALVGGPDINDNYVDARDDYRANEVNNTWYTVF
jgi:Glycosyl hydrolase family 9